MTNVSPKRAIPSLTLMIVLTVYILSTLIVYQIASASLEMQNNPINNNNTSYLHTIAYIKTSFNSDVAQLDNNALSLFDSGRYSEANSVFDQALAMDPNDRNALDGKAIALFYLGRYDEANSVLDKALAINPNDSTALDNKAAALNALKGIQ